MKLLQGETDRTRYVKIKTVEELDEFRVGDWIENAGRVGGWK